MISALARFFKIANNSKSYNLYKITMSKYSTGEYNHAYGKIWCYHKNTQEILFLKKELFNEKIHIKGLPHQRGGYIGYIWINKDGVRKAVPENLVTDFILDGWVLGRNVILTKENQSKMFNGRTKNSFKSQSEKMRNKVEITNHIEIKKINKEEIQFYLSLGYILVKGAGIKRKHKRKCFINGVEYNSVLEATRKTGFTYANIKARLLSDDCDWNYIN